MGKFMATSKDFMEYLLENSLSDENVSYRPMMGEYLVSPKSAKNPHYKKV